MKRAIYNLANSLMLIIILINITGCEVKNPTEGVEVKLRAPFQKEIYNETDDTPELVLEPKLTVLAEDSVLSGGGVGKSRSSLMTPDDSEIYNFATGLTILDFINNYMNNPNKTASLFSGLITNNGNTIVELIFYLGTSTEHQEITRQTFYPGASGNINIPFGLVHNHKNWFQARNQNHGLYFGVKVVVTGGYNITLNKLTIHTPPFIYIHRVVNRNDLDEQDTDGFNIDDLDDIVVEDVELRGIIKNQGNSEVILKIDMEYFENATQMNSISFTESLDAKSSIKIEEMDPPLITPERIDTVKTAVKVLFDHNGTYIDFKVYCYSTDGVSPINVTIEHLSINTVALISQIQ